MPPYQVFISFKNLSTWGEPTRDSELARLVYERLSAAGYTVFLSTVELAEQGVAGYKQAIDDALDAATVLVAVGTSAEHLNSRWVRYEWDGIVNDILSNYKPEGRVFVYTEGVPVGELPRALRQTQCFDHERDGPEALLEFVRNTLSGRAMSPAAQGEPEGTAAAENVVKLPHRVRPLEVVESSLLAPPFAVDGLALEEDTSLILSADGVVRDRGEHPIRLMTDLYASDEQRPGTVIELPGEPPRLLAVVHDLDKVPTTCEAWVMSALGAVLERCGANGWRSLGLDPLGCVHGRFPRETFRELLDAALLDVPRGAPLKRVWLRTPDRWAQ